MACPEPEVRLTGTVLSGTRSFPGMLRRRSTPSGLCVTRVSRELSSRLRLLLVDLALTTLASNQPQPRDKVTKKNGWATTFDNKSELCAVCCTAQWKQAHRSPSNISASLLCHPPQWEQTVVRSHTHTHTHYIWPCWYVNRLSFSYWFFSFMCPVKERQRQHLHHSHTLDYSFSLIPSHLRFFSKVCGVC